MILSAKRGASSPAEAEKKKPDKKSTPSDEIPGGDGMWGEVDSLAGTSHDQGGWQKQGSPTRNRKRNGSGKSSDSDVNQQDQIRSFSEVARQGASRQSNNDRSMGPNPEFLHRHTIPVFKVRNEGAFRDEVEVEIRTINGDPFRGSLTRHEAKHLIYKGVLGCPFSNFRGCKTGFKGCPTVTFMLKEQINIDDLESVREFSFKRSYTKQGKLVEDVLEGIVRGVRTVSGSEATASYSEDWTRVVKVEGCDYRIEAEMILKWLGKYGEVKSDLVEDVFEDGEDSEGENATGIYSVKVKMNHNIPQLLPMDGRRVKIYYRGIQKLCTKCFGGHLCRNCSDEKAPWLSYVRSFVESNSDFDDEMYGNWIQILAREQRQLKVFKDHFDGKNQPPKETGGEAYQLNEEGDDTQSVTTGSGVAKIQQEIATTEDNVEPHNGKGGDMPQKIDATKPKPKDFNLPETEESIQDLIGKMVACGMTVKDATDNIDKRKKLLNQAVKKHQTLEKAKKARVAKPRKESLNE